MVNHRQLETYLTELQSHQRSVNSIKQTKQHVSINLYEGLLDNHIKFAQKVYASMPKEAVVN